MKQFQHEKTKLLQVLANESNQPQNTDILKLIEKIQLMCHHTDFDRSFTLLISEAKGLSPALQNTLLDFDQYYQDKTNWIQSHVLRKLAKSLLENGIPITFYGRTWTRQTADWMYFDVVLDVDTYRKQLQMGDHIHIHENLDPHSGTERGFIDTDTGEGIIGKLS